jgi:DNA mismatch repair protein MutS2
MSNNTTSMHQESLKACDWDEIIHKINHYAHFDASKQSLIQNPFITGPDKIKEYYAFYHCLDLELEKDRLQGLENNLKRIPLDMNFESIEAKLYKKRILSIEQLHQSYLALETFFSLQDFFLTCGFNKKYIEIEDWKGQNTLFRKLVSHKGTIKYESHPLTKNLALEKNQLNKNIEKTLDQVLNHASYQKKLRYNSYDIRHDYYVVPIKAGEYQLSDGPIIDKSDTEQTFYVSPKQVVQSCHRIHIINMELEKILAEQIEVFSNYLFPLAANIQFIHQLLIDFDILLTKYHFSLANSYSVPHHTQSDHFEFDEIYHPLIEDPVTNNINTENKKGLIISGPNTGGKSVLLKSIALSHYFYRMALYVPAKHSVCRYFNQIYFFAENHQDIQKGLSSFSQEAHQYLEMIENLEDNSLIIFDEIFNSTSSEEGSAISMSLINHLLATKNVYLLLSSHHNQLKIHLHQHPDFLSAHMGFNVKNLTPTYKIFMGSPGSSKAISIFSGFNDLSKKLAVVAQEYLDLNQIKFEHLLAQLEKEKNIQHALTKKARKHENQKYREIASNRGLLRLELEKQVDEYKAKLDLIIKEAEQRLDNVKNKRNVDSIAYLKSQLVSEQFKPDVAQEKEQAEEFIEGKIYFSKKFNRNVKLIKILNAKQLKVAMGSIQSKVHPSDLYKAKEHAVKNDPIKFSIQLNEDIELKNKLDLRGFTIEEAEKILQQYLPYLQSQKLLYLEIIHGVGPLKNWLYPFINEFKCFDISTTKPGNMGSSYIKLL